MWAVAQMKEGKKVKRNGWGGADEILTPLELANDLMFVDSDGKRKLMGLISIEATDWEIFNEKCKTCNGREEVTIHCPLGYPGCVVHHTKPCPDCEVEDKQTLSDKMVYSDVGICTRSKHYYEEDVKKAISNFIRKVDCIVRSFEFTKKHYRQANIGLYHKYINKEAKEIFGERLT